MKVNTVLFVYRFFSTFIERDLSILEKRYNLIVIQATNNVLKSLLKFLINTLFCDMIFVWFAGHHAFLSVLFAKLFRKKVVVVAGGYDAAYAPEIDYGVFTCWWRAAMALCVYRNADLVLPVSYHTQEELSHIKTRRSIVIYNGVDTQKFVPDGRKERYVLTVGAVNSSNLKKKGLETFVRAAKYLPKTRFVLVGRHIDETVKHLRQIASENVEFPGFVTFEELLNFYQNATVYAQLSYHESFGVALAEAMACECVPVVTGRAALDEVVGNCGLYVPYGDVEATAEAIQEAFNLKDLGKCARKRIVRIFSVDKREKNLMKAINGL